jgi:ligand-binding sensor domain-containing protein/putative methionine-R-sulfoxide reductase with GAF domain
MCQLNPVFYNLNTNNGLSYIGINDLCVDKKGNLWIATGNGLNVFNGRTTEKFYSTEYPQLDNSNINAVACDKNNCIWVVTAGHKITMIDERRKLHKLTLQRDKKPEIVFGLLPTPRGEMYVYANRANYQYIGATERSRVDSLDNSQFKFLPLRDYDKFKFRGFNSAFPFDENYYLLVFRDGVLKVNFKTNIVESRFEIPLAHPLCKWKENELMFYDLVDSQLKVINFSTKQISTPLSGLKDQFDREVTSVINQAKPINSYQFLLTCPTKGIYIWDTAAKKIFNYRHSVADPTSVSNNTQGDIAIGLKGWVFLNCTPSGVSYFNSNAIIGNQTVFQDYKGNDYDGDIFGIATKDNNTFYLGTNKGLVKWKRSTNTTTFSNILDETGQSLFQNKEITSVIIDRKNRVWASNMTNGIVVTDENLNLIKHFKYSPGNDRHALKIKSIRRIMISPSGDVWACGNYGVNKINPETFVVDTLGNSPLQAFRNRNVAPIIFTDEQNIWFASGGNGVYHYNLQTKRLDSIKKENGLVSAAIFDINCDSFKNIYVGTIAGLIIISPNGKIKTLTQKDGLLIDRAEGLLLDKHNRMWIGNDIGFACYNPSDSSLRTFDERYGLSIYGFRVGSYFKLSNGEFIMGTPKGLQYFYSDSLFNKKLNLNVSITKMESKNVSETVIDNANFKLSAKDNQVTFYFGSVDFSPHVRTYYEYKLVDLDKNWIRLVDQNSVRYNSLPPGNYVFKLRTSSDSKSWQEADNEVALIIAAPFYLTWWFRTLSLVAGLIIIWYVLKYFTNKQLKKREELETEVVINYFASEINKHQNIDAMLWDIARNCISRLNFEDCVIYLLDDEKKVLIQKAAYGPKMERDFTIYQPIEIPVGNGIVGTVAQTGKAELIANTELDKRYIADDAKRFSELAVPLIVDNKIIGVIDSEHSQKNFFKQKHLNILSTIAVLCAAQIQRVCAEEEKQQAKIETIENKQKMTESRLQSLRLQMNPHFLFNALNSIQQMILANEEIVATRYLSKFSKLLRMILVHSDKEYVTLKEELEILHLYIELESIRFKDSFKYTIECDDQIDADEIKLPTLLIQPFVENAIWHGLMHKEGDRLLQVKFSEQRECISCIVEDNGIGREKSSAARLATGQGKKHTSKGIQVSMERLKAMNNGNGEEGSLKIVDLKNENGMATGTRVEIIFPCQNN